MRKTFFFHIYLNFFKKQADVMRYEDKIKIKQQREHLAIISLQTIFKRYTNKNVINFLLLYGVYRL